jgi:hypothetical protein
MMELAKNMACVYFTPLPYMIYDQSNKCGNMAYAGVGLGLIQSQQIFWVSNSIMAVVIYNFNDTNFIFLNLILFYFSLGLYIMTFVKTTNLLRYLITNY